MIKNKKTLGSKKKKLSLPTKRSIPVEDLGGYSILIYGQKKIGKTTMCRHFPDAMYAMFERGTKKLSVYRISPKSWKQFKGYVELILEDKRFKTIIVDPVDRAYDMCFEYCCNKLAINHPADLDWGVGWGAIKKEFSKEINKLTNSGKGVIFISHQKTIEIKNRAGTKQDYTTNTMAGQASEMVVGDVDVWANYDFDDDGNRVLTILGDKYIDAGHRLNEPPDKRFMYTNDEPIKEISMGRSSSEAYKNFINAFNNKLEKPKVKLKSQKKRSSKWLRKRSGRKS